MSLQAKSGSCWSHGGFSPGTVCFPLRGSGAAQWLPPCSPGWSLEPQRSLWPTGDRGSWWAPDLSMCQALWEFVCHSQPKVVFCMPSVLSCGCGAGPRAYSVLGRGSDQPKGCESLSVPLSLPSSGTGPHPGSPGRRAFQVFLKLPWLGVAGGGRRRPERLSRQLRGRLASQTVGRAGGGGAVWTGGRSQSCHPTDISSAVQNLPAGGSAEGRLRLAGRGRPRPAFPRRRTSWAHLEMFDLIECRFTLQK